MREPGAEVWGCPRHADIFDGCLVCEVERLRAVLREVEWKGQKFIDYDLGKEACPACDGLHRRDLDAYDLGVAGRAGMRVGHATDCKLAAALRP